MRDRRKFLYPDIRMYMLIDAEFLFLFLAYSSFLLNFAMKFLVKNHCIIVERDILFYTFFKITNSIPRFH